jgi:hypothetical protein
MRSPSSRCAPASHAHPPPTLTRLPRAPASRAHPPPALGHSHLQVALTAHGVNAVDANQPLPQYTSLVLPLCLSLSRVITIARLSCAPDEQARKWLELGSTVKGGATRAASGLVAGALLAMLSMDAAHVHRILLVATPECLRYALVFYCAQRVGGEKGGEKRTLVRAAAVQAATVGLAFFGGVAMMWAHVAWARASQPTFKSGEVQGWFYGEEW